MQDQMAMAEMIDSKDFSRYNPEGSALRRDQMELLRMLEKLAGICDANDIPWWLSSGTLLGAIRHKGFIPWDDDVDIVMFREDCMRLEKVLLEMEDDEYVFHSNKTDPDYVYVFGKFRKRDGEYEVMDRRSGYYKWRGLSIDIFSIEKTSYLAAQLARFFYKTALRVSQNVKNRKWRHRLIAAANWWGYRCVFPFFRFIGRLNPNGEYHYTMGIGWAKSTFYMKDILPLSRASFEGRMMPVPKDADAYLTNVYGDWRQLPSDAQIKKAIHSREYRDEIFPEDK